MSLDRDEFSGEHPAHEPRIALIVTCFNAGATLRDAVLSAAPDADELVVVDDGSTDPATLDVLRDLERDNTRVIHRPNGGLSAALMTGVEATTSPYVFRFDADDLLESGQLKRLADALESHPTAAAAWGDLQTFGMTSLRVASVPVLDPWFVTYASLLPASSLYRRSALVEIGGWQMRMPYEDWDVWMALAERGYTGVYVPTVVYRYRRHQGSLMMASLDRFPELYAELQRRHERLFAARRANRGSSSAPKLLKILVPLIDRFPVIRPLWKLWAIQVLTTIVWSRRPLAAARLVFGGISARSKVMVSNNRGRVQVADARRSRASRWPH